MEYLQFSKLINNILDNMANNEYYSQVFSKLAFLVVNYTGELVSLVEDGTVDVEELSNFKWDVDDLKNDLFSKGKAYQFLECIEELPTMFKTIGGNVKLFVAILNEEYENVDNSECQKLYGQGIEEWRADMKKLHQWANLRALDYLNKHIPSVLYEYYKEQ